MTVESKKFFLKDAMQPLQNDFMCLFYVCSHFAGLRRQDKKVATIDLYQRVPLGFSNCTANAYGLNWIEMPKASVPHAQRYISSLFACANTNRWDTNRMAHSLTTLPLQTYLDEKFPVSFYCSYLFVCLSIKNLSVALGFVYDWSTDSCTRQTMGFSMLLIWAAEKVLVKIRPFRRE